LKPKKQSICARLQDQLACEVRGNAARLRAAEFIAFVIDFMAGAKKSDV
jgi:hypothetical protein